VTKPQTACSEVYDVNTSTPILSKDGKRVSFSTRTGTKVFEIGEKGRCKEVFSLGRQTSKANFSHDGRYLTFIENVGSKDPLNPKVYSTGTIVDLETRKEYSISPAVDGSEVVGYPTFFPDGRVLAQVIRTTPDRKQTRDLVIIQVDELVKWTENREENLAKNSKNLEKFRAVCVNDPAKDELKNLLEVWQDICHTQVTGADPVLSLFSRMTRDGCLSFVDRYWKARAPHLSSSPLKKSELQSLCAPKDIGDGNSQMALGPVLTLTSNKKSRSGLEILQEKCSGCHQEGTPGGYIDFNSRESLMQTRGGNSLAERILQRIEGPGVPRMPPPPAEPITEQLDNSTARPSTDCRREGPPRFRAAEAILERGGLRHPLTPRNNRVIRGSQSQKRRRC